MTGKQSQAKPAAANAVPTERDLERLGDLIAGYDRRARFGFPPRFDGEGVWDGVAPIDCGGTDGSDHSYRFTRLVKLGLAEHCKRGHEWGDVRSTGARGSKLYRPTEAGRALNAKARGESA